MSAGGKMGELFTHKKDENSKKKDLLRRHEEGFLIMPTWSLFYARLLLPNNNKDRRNKKSVSPKQTHKSHVLPLSFVIPGTLLKRQICVQI